MKMMRWMILAAVIPFSAAACGDVDDTESQQPEVEQQPSEDVPETKEEAADLTNQGKADWTLDICKANGWYGDGTCDWFCPKRDSDCNSDPLGPEPAGRATAYPIVLAHGFMASPTNFWAFLNVEEALEADGHLVYEGEVPPFHSPKVRAERLAAQIDRVLEETGAEKVNIVAHSMGGIDSRYLISTLGYGDRVASLTTISSPHGGSRIADVALKLTPGAFDEALDAILVFLGKRFSNDAEEADLRAALEGIAEANVEQFDRDNPDDSRVFYQSWAGISAVTGLPNRDAEAACEGKMLLHEGTYDHMDGLLWAVVPFLTKGLSVEPNDGMVNVAAAKHGEFRGCIPADHLDEVGQIDDEMNLNTGFDHIRFYRNLAFDLAARGF